MQLRCSAHNLWAQAGTPHSFFLAENTCGVIWKSTFLLLYPAVSKTTDIGNENLRTPASCLSSALPSSCCCLSMFKLCPQTRFESGLDHIVCAGCSHSVPRGKVQIWTLACVSVSLAGNSLGSWLTEVSLWANKLSSLRRGDSIWAWNPRGYDSIAMGCLTTSLCLPEHRNHGYAWAEQIWSCN